MKLADLDKRALVLIPPGKAFADVKVHEPVAGAFPLAGRETPSSGAYSTCGRKFYQALTVNDAILLRWSACEKCWQEPKETVDITGEGAIL